MRTLLELAEIHLRTLYVTDERGRLVKETVDEGRDAPRIAVVTTADGVLQCLRHDVTDDEACSLLTAAEANDPELRIGGGPIFCVPEGLDRDLEVVETASDVFTLLLDGEPVSACWSSRDVGDAVQAGVETKEAFRGCGYATRVVRTWAATMKDRGKEPIYSTSRENLASQAVARKVGLVLVGTDYNVY